MDGRYERRIQSNLWHRPQGVCVGRPPNAYSGREQDALGVHSANGKLKLLRSGVGIGLEAMAPRGELQDVEPDENGQNH
jgi:hypothetical protein